MRYAVNWLWKLNLQTNKVSGDFILIDKSGENPARSRRCNGEQIQLCHWETGKAG